MREKIKISLSILIILILLPYVAVVFGMGRTEDEAEKRQTELERCVERILPVQIPVTCEPEALKAQAVVIRTNLLKKAEEYYGISEPAEAGAEVREADLEKLGFHGFSREEEQLWNRETRGRYEEKCSRAAEETAGQVLVWEGQPVEVPYHAVSAGKTREGSLLGEDYRWLEPASCDGDTEAADYLRIMYLPGLALPGIESRDSAGYVTKLSLDGETLTGEDFRFRYGLNSSCFTAEETEEGVRIVTRGLGHGFGMSQYSANLMAAEGWKYREILAYFYKNLDCISFTENGYARDSMKTAE